MSNKPQVYLDQDGVIAGFISGICSAHKRPNPYHHPNAKGVWDVWTLWEMSHADFWEPCDMTFWHKLPKTPEADDLVRLAISASRRVCGVWPVRVLTMPSSHGRDECIQGKLNWLEDHYPELAGEIIFENEKWKYAAAQPGSLLIDDNEQNCQKWVRNGGYAVLVPRPWNMRWRVADQVVDVVRQGVEAWMYQAKERRAAYVPS